MRTSIFPLIVLLLFVVRMSYAQQETEQIAPPDTAGFTQFTTHPANERSAAWSPDDKWLAFTSNRSGNEDLWIKPVAGGEAIQVTEDPAEATNRPAALAMCR
jgi:Tol biopolymer transport system component